jgi:hypothetical protein
MNLTPQMGTNNSKDTCDLFLSKVKDFQPQDNADAVLHRGMISDFKQCRKASLKYGNKLFVYPTDNKQVEYWFEGIRGKEETIQRCEKPMGYLPSETYSQCNHLKLTVPIEKPER